MQCRCRSEFWAQRAQVGVEIFFGDLMNMNAGASGARPGGVVKLEESTVRRCAAADFTHGKSDWLFSFLQDRCDADYCQFQNG